MHSKILGIAAIAFALLFTSCSKENLESVNEPETSSTTSIAKTNARTYAPDACLVCIDPEAPDYSYQQGVVNGVIGNNPKSISYKAYNTLTNFVVELSYYRGGNQGSAQTAVDVTVGSETKRVFLTPDNQIINPSPNLKTLTFELPANWVGCQTLTWSFVEVSGIFSGQYPLSLSTSYNLVPECKIACTDNFGWIANGENSYTFTYISDEAIANAALSFTFAQGVVVSGLDGWSHNENSQTYKLTENIEACKEYKWTVTLTPDANANCNGAKINLWTDFTVNGVSAKTATTPKIEITCNN